MNYLGHAYLSFGDADILTGNMIGDHVKGSQTPSETYPERIWKGIQLHRKIDEFSDNHPATKRAKVFFREDYGLYAGAIMDTLYDHFLANDPQIFENAGALEKFSTQVYDQLAGNAQWLPSDFAAYFPHMREHNWLYGYRALKSMERSLNGLHRRARHMPSPEKAYEIFITNFYQLNQCYFELIDDLVAFVKIQLAN